MGYYRFFYSTLRLNKRTLILFGQNKNKIRFHSEFAVKFSVIALEFFFSQ